MREDCSQPWKPSEQENTTRKAASHQNVPKSMSEEWYCGCFLSFHVLGFLLILQDEHYLPFQGKTQPRMFEGSLWPLGHSQPGRPAAARTSWPRPCHPLPQLLLLGCQLAGLLVSSPWKAQGTQRPEDPTKRMEKLGVSEHLTPHRCQPMALLYCGLWGTRVSPPTFLSVSLLSPESSAGGQAGEAAGRGAPGRGEQGLTSTPAW